jgi:hypothetical protein
VRFYQPWFFIQLNGIPNFTEEGIKFGMCTHTHARTHSNSITSPREIWVPLHRYSLESYYFSVVTYLLTYSLTPHSTVLLEKLTGLQLIKKSPAFCGTRKFISALTSSRKLSLSRVSSIQSKPPYLTSWKTHLNTVLSFHLSLGLPCCIFHSGSPTPFLSPIHATFPAHLILLNFITCTIFGEQYISLSSSMRRFGFTLRNSVPNIN